MARDRCPVRYTLRRAATALAAAGALAACAETTQPSLARLALPADSLTLGLRRTLQLDARVYAADGRLDTGAAVVYRSGSPTFVSVSGTGLLTAVATGSAAVIAFAAGGADTVVVTVPPPQPSGFHIVSAPSAVAIAASEQVDVRVIDEDGFSILGLRASLETAAPDVLTASPTGTIAGVRSGRTWLRIRFAHLLDSIPVVVYRPFTLQPTLVPLDGEPIAVAIVEDRDVLVTQFAANTVTRLDLQDLRATVIPVDSGPLAIAVSPDGHRAYTANGRARTVTAIDLDSNRVVGSWPLPPPDYTGQQNDPLSIIVSPDNARVFVSVVEGGVHVFDALAGSFLTTIRVLGYGMGGMSLTADGRQIIGAAWYGTIWSVDVGTLREGPTGFLVGRWLNHALVLRAGDTLAYVGAEEGTRVVSLTQRKTTDTLVTQLWSQHLLLSADETLLFVTGAYFSQPSSGYLAFAAVDPVADHIVRLHPLSFASGMAQTTGGTIVVAHRAGITVFR